MSDARPAPSFEQARDIMFTLAVLSLDLARGTLPSMGLEVADEAAFRQALRAESLAPLAGEADAPRASSVLSALEARFGSAFVDRLVVWIEEVFLGPSDPQVFLWRCVVRSGRSVTAPPFITRLREEIAGRRVAPGSDEPQTAYDTRMLAAYGFPTLAVRGEMTSTPMVLVRGLLEDRAFLAAWKRTLGRMPDARDAIDAAFKWGKAESIQLGFEKLGRPDSFSGGPS